MNDTITITDLTKVAAENNLPANNADVLQAAFMPFFEQASEWRDKAFAIKVTNIGQTAEMGRARQARLALKDIRVQTEKTRIQMKEDSLRTGKAIDGMANVIKFLIAPIEQHLQDQEDYGKRMQEKAQAEQRDLRTCEAGDLIRYFPHGVDLGAIADEEYAKHLHLAKVQDKAVRDETDRVERERIEREQKEAAEREAMRAENEQLRAEAEKIEAEREIERTAALIAKQQAGAAIAAERAEVERLERAERERIAAENRAKMEADNAERERLRKEQAEKEAAERAAMEAPDKEKLHRLAVEIQYITLPEIESKEMKKVLDEANHLLISAIEILHRA